MRFILCFCLLFGSSLSALNRLDLLKSFPSTPSCFSLEGVDDMFIINLDKRPSKYASCLNQCAQYGITPKRFSAIDGQALSKEFIESLGVVLDPDMKKGPITLNPLSREKKKANFADVGKPGFFYRLSAGGVGCYLSHITLAKHLLESCHQALWILEDDFLFLDDPRRISQEIDRLNSLVGKENWDILFTDDEHYFSSEGDFDFYRPDGMAILKEFFFENSEYLLNLKKMEGFSSDVCKLEKAHFLKWGNVNKKGFICSKYPDLFSEFRRISGRFMIHSMVLKRSGAEKILEFFSKRGMFLPYDDELAFIPGLKMYNLKNPITSHQEEISDTNR